MTHFDDLTPAEQSFRDLLGNPKALRAFARERLHAWAAEHPEQITAWERATAERRTWPGRGRAR